MHRREFFRNVAAAAAFSAVPSMAAEAPKRALKKAVNLGMSKAGATVLEKFQIIKEAGFHGVEVNRPDVIEIGEILTAKAATGLEIAGVICTTHWGKPLNHPDEHVREQGLNGLKLALKEAGELGCGRVLLVPGVVKADMPYDDCWKYSVAAIKQAAIWAQEANTKIAVENVWNQFLTSPMEAVRFLEEIDSPSVGWHLDIGNIVTYGWPEQWVRILGTRILNLHIKEFSRKKRDAEGLWKGFQTELGEGDVNWAAVMKALDATGYNGYGIAEVPGGDVPRMQFLSQRMDQLFAS